MQFAQLANYHCTNAVEDFANFLFGLNLPKLCEYYEGRSRDFWIYYRETRMTRVFEKTKIALEAYVCDSNISIVNDYFDVNVNFVEHEQNIQIAYLQIFSKTSIFFRNLQESSILNALLLNYRHDRRTEQYWVCVVREFCVEYGIEVLNFLLPQLLTSETSYAHNRLVLQAVSLALEGCNIVKTRCQQPKNECHCHIYNQIALRHIVTQKKRKGECFSQSKKNTKP